MYLELQKAMDLLNGPYSILAVLFLMIWIAKNKSIVELIKYTWSRNLNQISFIKNSINYYSEDSPEKRALIEKRDRLVFRKLFGITASKYKREYLINLYDILGQDISLESICKAEKYILYHENIYKIKKFSKFEKANYYFNNIMFFVLFAAAIIFMITIFFYGKQNIIVFIFSILVFFYVFGIGFFIASGNWPIVYAKRIGAALENVQQTAQPSATSAAWIG